MQTRVYPDPNLDLVWVMSEEIYENIFICEA